jgi:hypothetical protein
MVGPTPPREGFELKGDRREPEAPVPQQAMMRETWVDPNCTLGRLADRVPATDLLPIRPRTS